jgi:hypothetical protein
MLASDCVPAQGHQPEVVALDLESSSGRPAAGREGRAGRLDELRRSALTQML